jgi:hypothetical protein
LEFYTKVRKKLQEEGISPANRDKIFRSNLKANVKCMLRVAAPLVPLVPLAPGRTGRTLRLPLQPAGPVARSGTLRPVGPVGPVGPMGPTSSSAKAAGESAKHAHATDANASRDIPVVYLQGPRQSGKSTLAQALRDDGREALCFTLEDAATLSGILEANAQRPTSNIELSREEVHDVVIMLIL